MVHSLANGPEVTKPLLETSRRGYLAASSASAYSMVSLVQRFGPIMPKGGTVVSLTYIASEKVRNDKYVTISSLRVEHRNCLESPHQSILTLGNLIRYIHFL